MGYDFASNEPADKSRARYFQRNQPASQWPLNPRPQQHDSLTVKFRTQVNTTTRDGVDSSRRAEDVCRSQSCTRGDLMSTSRVPFFVLSTLGQYLHFPTGMEVMVRHSEKIDRTLQSGDRTIAC